MIYGIIAALVCTNALLTYLLVLAHKERRTLMAAALQANGQGDAARRIMTPTHKEAKEAADLQMEMMANAPEFSATNPFGSSKPIGL